MDIDELINRIKRAERIKSDKDLADSLGISPQNFSNRRRRGTLEPLLYELVGKKGIDLDESETAGPNSEIHNQPKAVDVDLLCQAIEDLEGALLAQGGGSLAPAKKATIIAMIYDMRCVGKEMTPSRLERLVKLAL